MLKSEVREKIEKIIKLWHVRSHAVVFSSLIVFVTAKMKKKGRMKLVSAVTAENHKKRFLHILL